jgi:parvulin-like peptidyl-prolyl isomerase
MAGAVGLGGLVAAAGPAAAQTKAPPASAAADRPVAVVNGEPISRADFDKAFKRVPQPAGAVNDTQKRAMQLDLLGLMIDEVLLQQFLKKTMPPTDPALVNARMAELQTALKAKSRTLQDYLEETGMTEARLREAIAAGAQWNAYLAKRITDDDLKKCFEENRELFDGVLIRASHVLIRANPGDGKGRLAAAQKAEAVRQDVLRGMDFAEAARKHSQDPSAQAGGDLGYFPPRKSDPDPFIRTASSLKVGEVSDVVQADYGFHVIKVTDRKSGKPVRFEEVKDEARLLLAEDLRHALITDLRKSAKIEVNLP